jgi:hypothetical protein
VVKRLEEIEMNEAAYRAIEEAWTLTVKTRALCPYTDDSVIGMTGYLSPPWYRSRGATYFVNLAQPLTGADIEQLRQIGNFVNRSFVIFMAASLEEYGVIRSGHDLDRSRDGGDHAQLTRWLRNRFAHGEWQYDANDPEHRKTRALLEKLFPEAASRGSGFVTSIDGILEPLKDGVLTYIRSAS